MPTRHIALVPEFGLNPSELARVSAALQKQVTRDLAPVWEVSATVDSFPSLEDVPAGYWPIVVTFRALASEAGFHIDRNGHPYALVEMCPSWSVTASRICLEAVTDQLVALLDVTQEPALDQPAFPETQADEQWTWTPLAPNPAAARYVDFGVAFQRVANHRKTVGQYVRSVR